MKLNDYIKLSWNNFLRNGFKSVAPITIISLSIIILNIILSLFSSITSSVNTTVIDNQSLKIIEISSNSENELTSSSFKELKEIDNVVTAFPKIEAFVGVEYKNGKTTTNLVGVNDKGLEYFTSNKVKGIRDNQLVINSSLTDELSPNEKVKISYTVKVKDGEGIRKTKKALIQSKFDQFYLDNYPEDISLGSIDFVEKLNADFLGLSLKDYRKNLTYEFGSVIVNNVENLPQVADDIEKLGYDTGYSLKASQSIPLVAKVIIAIGGIVLIVLLIFSGISIASVIGQSLRNRYKEIGIMRTFGYEKSHLINLFSIEVLIISLISFVISVISSFIIIELLDSYLGKFMGVNFDFSVNMTGIQIFISLILIVLVSFISSFRPILKASSINITEIIRGNDS
ncbi:ABC transporter permease [Bacillus sp. 179-C3.3 HS]|uniref:ABC transporter permease n=1 Tax=Bacillus sp. 179-C3.3 HS TaxID=3232162 RepID=UPI0039A14A14